MKFLLLLLLFCIPVQEEFEPDQADRLAPLRLRAVNAPSMDSAFKLLDKTDLVDASGALLKQLKAVQQAAWDARKSVKGRAWHSFMRKKDTRGSIVLLEFSIVPEPRQTKYLAYYFKDAFKARREGRKPKPVKGADPDAKEALFFTGASIRTPKYFANGMFLARLNDNAANIIEVHDHDYNAITFSTVFDHYLFRYEGSPSTFFEESLPKRIEKGYSQKLKKRGDLVELSLWSSNVKEKPIYLWLFDLSKSGSCVYYYRFGGGSVETEFAKWKQHWLPKRAIHLTGKQRSETTFFDMEMTPNFGPKEFSVTSFPVDPRTTVYDKARQPTRLEDYQYRK